MFRHIIHCLVFVAVIGISLTMVTNLFRSRFDKEVFITGNAHHAEKPSSDSTAADYTGNPDDDVIRHK